jgi:hypothetical protein
MWTKKSHFVYFHLHIRYFNLPLVIPLNILRELVDIVEDMLLLFGRFAGIDPRGVIRVIAEIEHTLVHLGHFDLVDVEAGKGREKVTVKIFLR